MSIIRTRISRGTVLWTAASLGTAAMLAGCGGSSSSDADAIATALAGKSPQHRIEVLSSEPHLVSGGNALVRVTLPPGIVKNGVTILAAGQDMTGQFQEVEPGALLGVVDGLPVGQSTIEVVPVHGKGLAGSLAVRNWPIEGPIISGPHQTPFYCQTHQFILPDGSNLGPALDENCSVVTRVHYLYRVNSGGAFQVLPSVDELPADVGTTTTSSGATVPFVVRVETGTVNRGIYQSAILHDPTTEAAPTPLAPPQGWNGRLIAIQGFGCPGGWYIQGAAQGNLAFPGLATFTLLDQRRLAEGYALFANTLHHASNNCNAVLASEANMMSKERFVKTFGVPEFTVSAGCSGGSYGSAQPADRLPKLFDGVMILCTFPDPLSIALTGSDGHLMTNFLYQTHPGTFSDAQITAITGHMSVQAFIDAANQAGRTDPVPGRVDLPGYNSAPFNPIVPVSVRYHPITNPTGIRGTVYDAAKNIYGIDPVTGFALRPFDNAGVQYGLAALNNGLITVDQFLLLNEHIGGYDQDANYVANRTVGDPGAMTRAQQSGLQVGGNAGLASIPVFDVTGLYNDNSGYHYQWFHFSLRERMAQWNGDTDNHVMWRGNPVPEDTSWNAFIEWVAAYKADTHPGTQRERVIRNKPIQDGCWSNPTTFIAEPQTLSSEPDSVCNTLFPSWTFPRHVAGGTVAANIMKCDLKPVNPADYAVVFTGPQMAKLNSIFPSGVCDWSKPGNAAGVVPNGSFGPSPENLIFDVTAI
jgi:hypothetical protein